MNSQNLGQLHQVVLFILVLDIYKNPNLDWTFEVTAR